MMGAPSCRELLLARAGVALEAPNLLCVAPATNKNDRDIQSCTQRVANNIKQLGSIRFGDCAMLL